MVDQLTHLDLLPPRVSEPLPAFVRSFDAVSDVVPVGRAPQPVALGRRTTIALWLLIAVGIVSCLALVVMLQAPAGCSGLACSIATYGGHPLLMLVFAAAGTAALLGLAAFTRGLTRASARALRLLVPAAGLTLASVTGVVAVLVTGMVIVLVALLAVVVTCAFFADHS
jgi:hypothetical protein